MKIWYQSGTSLDKDPRYSVYGATLKSYLSRIARPGNEVSVHGVDVCSPNLETFRYETLLHDHQIVENLLQAQREGYDVFCVGCFLDPAFYALREVANIPICFLAETTMFLASLLAPNFSLLCHHKPLLLRSIELVKRYGLQDRFIECDSLHVTPDQLLKAFNDPSIVLEPAREIAKLAAEKGACMFVNAEGILNMIMAKHNIHEIEGVPVLEGGGALIKMGEMLVDLKNMGVDRSKLGLYLPIPKDDLASLRRLYGKE